MGGYDSGVPDLSPLAAFRAMVESARDIESPAERRRVLRLFSSQLTQLQAEVERINDQTDLAEQGAALGAEFDMLQARSDADLREELIRRGLASDEDLDKEGVLSHEELDAAAADPAIREGLFGAGAGLAAKFEERLHPRGRGGKFADKPGGPPKPPARRRPAPPKPQNPGSGTTGYTDKAKELDARVKEKSRAGVKDRDAESAVDATLGGPKKPQNPGSKGPVANAAAPRWAGHASQQELLAYSRQAATQATTVDAYADRASDGSLVFDESRKQLHEQIISKLLDSIPAQAAGQARVMFTGGGYSAGKGGVLNGHPDAIPDGNDPKGADDPQRGLVLDPDVIKAMLPEFDAMLDSDPEANLLCHDDRTETLTEHGWLGLDEIRRRWFSGERFRIAAFDMATSKVRYEVPRELRVYDYDGNLHYFRHQSFDLAVTPDHRMVARPRCATEWRIARARDLTYQADGRSTWDVPFVSGFIGGRVDEMVLPAVRKYTERPLRARAQARYARIQMALAEGTGRGEVARAEDCSRALVDSVATGRIRRRPAASWPERRLPMDDFLGYLGWWLAEGDATGAVCQSSASPFLRECQEACRATGWPATEDSYRDDEMWAWRPTGPARQLRAWLAENCGTGAYGKRVPAFVFDLAPEQQMVVLRGLVNGDGACGGEPWDGVRSATFGSVSSELADGAQRLALACGLRASKRPRGRGAWAVQMSRPKSSGRRLPKPSLLPYRGQVYCFTTPSSTMVTRRNGFVGITGNCYEEAWHISQELQRRAIAKNVNMTVDGISDTSKDDMLGRVKLFTDAKYQHPKVVYVDIPTDEAIKRAANRAAKAKKRSDRRFIPEVIMRAVHRDVAATIPDVMKAAASAGLDVEVWDNNQGWDAANDRPIPPVMIARSAESGVETIGDLGEALWKALLAKGQEKISGVDDIAEAASDEEAGMDEQSTDTGGEGAEQGTGEVVDGYIDLPYESGSSDPQPLEYADLGPGKKYVPGEDFREAQKRAGSSGGEGEDGRGDSAKE